MKISPPDAVLIGRNIIFFALSIVCSIQILSAGGPSKVATINRKLWPYGLNTKENFNLASHLTITAFIKSMSKLDTMGIEELKRVLELKSINTISFKRWKESVHEIMERNLARASVDRSFTPPAELKEWMEAAGQFCDIYLYEQARLAALFGSVSSEVLTYSPAEIQGHDFSDKHFVLTFDDGPSKQGGSTDKLTALLRERNLPGIFFVLGEKFERRLKLTSAKEIAEVYKGVSVQSHGMTHKSHARSSEWLKSIGQSISLVDSVFPRKEGRPSLFRPPYGQRVSDAASELERINCSIYLWNIDTQDWNTKISPDDAAGRAIMLMLLWRNGIILFHDIHEKAQLAIPIIADETYGSGIIWVDGR